MRYDRYPVLRAQIIIEGDAELMLQTQAHLMPENARKFILLQIRARSASGSHIEDYQLPAIRDGNIKPAIAALSGLLKQGRINKQDHQRACDIVARIGTYSGGHIDFWQEFARA